MWLPNYSFTLEKYLFWIHFFVARDKGVNYKSNADGFQVLQMLIDHYKYQHVFFQARSWFMETLMNNKKGVIFFYQLNLNN